MPRGQRLRRPIKRILSFGTWTAEKNQPPQYFQEYTQEIGEKFYRDGNLVPDESLIFLIKLIPFAEIRGTANTFFKY